MYIDEQQTALTGQMQVVEHMQSTRNPIQLDQPALLIGKIKGQRRSHQIRAYHRPQQSLIACRLALLPYREYRLKCTLQSDADKPAFDFFALDFQAEFVNI